MLLILMCPKLPKPGRETTNSLGRISWIQPNTKQPSTKL